MSDTERIEHRLAAVERAVIDGDYEVDELAELATLTETVERLEARVDEQEQRLATLEAKTESLAGFVDNVESVNDGVERQAATAVATVDRLEERIDELESALEAVRQESVERAGGDDGRTALTAGDPDRSDDRREAAAGASSTEVAFSEGTDASDGDAASPEQAVSEIVGDGGGSEPGAGADADAGTDGDFEWCDDEAGGDATAGTPNGEPGSAGVNAADQGSIDRMLADADGDRSERTKPTTGDTDGSDATESTDSDGLLDTVRSRLS